ncbi:MAG: carboxypeptidase regulatory-like domain-containing protein [Polyangiaceae bacterium]|nr:carboxypeptidase regulatory-like domain-containing protein [Polyangiaceae bacterium]
MNKRVLLAVALALAALLASVWLFRGRPPPAPAPAPVASARPARAPRPSGGGRSSWAPLRVSPAEAGPAEGGGAAVFEGRVISWSSGAPIKGAELTFAHDGVTSRVLSGEDGGFRFSPPEPGAYELVLATASGFLPFAPAWGASPIRWTARAGERVHGATISLTPAVTYSGEVQDPDGKPVEGAEVRVHTEDGGEGALVPTTDRAVSNAKGEFQLSAPDGALLEARHPAFAPARERLDFSAQVSKRVVLRLGRKQGGAEAAAKGRIAGRVIDGRGAPVEGALVQALRGEPVAPLDRDRQLVPATRSDEEGRFALEELDGGTFTIVAAHRELAPGRVEGVAVGAADVTITLERGGILRGSVRDAASGAPIASFTVVIWSSAGALGREPFTRRTFFDAQGAYEIAGLSPGSFLVMAVAAGHAPSSEASVTIADPPDAPATADFSLGRGTRVTGTVLDDKTRAPIEGARVSIEGMTGSGPSGEPLLSTAETDARGHFELGGLASGLRSLTVAAAGHHGRILSGLVASEGGDIGPITVTLTPTEEGEEPRIELTGIGAVLAVKGDALAIQKVIPGGGAEEAGLAPGDAVLTIDGAPVTELGFEGSIERIRGPEDSVVRLSVQRGGAGDPVEIPVRRRRIRG